MKINESIKILKENGYRLIESVKINDMDRLYDIIIDIFKDDSLEIVEDHLEGYADELYDIRTYYYYDKETDILKVSFNFGKEELEIGEFSKQIVYNDKKEEYDISSVLEEFKDQVDYEWRMCFEY